MCSSVMACAWGACRMRLLASLAKAWMVAWHSFAGSRCVVESLSCKLESLSCKARTPNSLQILFREEAVSQGQEASSMLSLTGSASHLLWIHSCTSLPLRPSSEAGPQFFLYLAPLQKRMGTVMKKAGIKGQLAMLCALMLLFVFLVILLLYT